VDIERRMREMYEGLKIELTDAQRASIASRQSEFDVKLADIHAQLALLAGQLVAIESSRVKVQLDAPTTDTSDTHSRLVSFNF